MFVNVGDMLKDVESVMIGWIVLVIVERFVPSVGFSPFALWERS
jgi:hypothetical protein